MKRLAPICVILLALVSFGPARGQNVDWSDIQPADRQWIEDACIPARRLGASYHQPCIQRNIKALQSHIGTAPSAGACEAERQRGPYYYFGCLDQTAARGASVLDPRPAPPGSVPQDMQVDATAAVVALPSWSPVRSLALATETRAATPEEIFRHVSPSIYVVIAARDKEKLARRQELSQGSAVAVTDRELVTNCHVVSGRPFIILAQKNKTTLAEVSAADRRADRCVLRAQDAVRPIHAVRRYDDLAVGERTYTIGSPSGLENTLSEGLISGLRRLNGIRLVQTTAPVSPGSSGGGLFDARGNLIGITTFITRNAQNLNFALSIDEFLSP